MNANSEIAQRKSHLATWLVTIVGGCLIAAVILGGPVNGLLKLREFDVAQQNWQFTVAERDSTLLRHERDIEVSDSRLASQQQQIISEQAAIAELKVESDRLKVDRDQTLLELAGLRKAEDLARQSAAEARTARDAASKTSAAAETARSLAEARAGELQSRETELKVSIASMQAQLDALAMRLSDETAAVAKVAGERDATAKRALTASQSVVDAGKELTRLQTEIATAAIDLKKVVTGYGSTVRDRESLLTEIAMRSRSTFP